MLHHVSIRTANIFNAIEFYRLLGFEVETRFTTGYTLACWLTGRGARIELIEIPEPNQAPDAFSDEHYVGYYHLSLDLSEYTSNLGQWVEELKSKFAHQQQIPPLKILLPPQQQIIGERIYQVAFIADTDGLPIELII